MIGHALVGMGLTAHVVIAAFVFSVVAGLPAWFDTHRRQVPRHDISHIGKPGPKHRSN